ncbi:hypothetical protein [Oceanobacillus bengalensis]|uniref:Lipoprotein n=1 Tax=Oceanobacillus bengalensis TaxID=1435466 RepID=A0A494YZD3_9BACI|nr:hypothetical protein [Oceanobacillus bengalensis]RKQ15367.1 hypothetical protein D8M05_10230 [Oceanobacillus bengalensis]
MKKQRKRFYCNVTLLLFVLLLVGCASDTSEESETATKENTSAQESEEETDLTEDKKRINDEKDESNPTTGTDESETFDSNDTSTEEIGNNESSNTLEGEENSGLSKYSSDEIEYARIWLQLGALKEVDELYVQHIPAGTALNPDDETSAVYPEDVIQLAGGRLVAGSVTYSGNGDGTINVYNVPLRWDGQYPAGEAFYKDIIENTKQVYVDPGDDEEIIQLINKIN